MEHISNETKAREIAITNCRCEGCYVIDTIDDCFHSALQAMQWKDEQHEQQKQQLIDKAVEWVDNNVNHYIFENEFGETYIKYTFTEDFIKAMKGE